MRFYSPTSSGRFQLLRGALGLLVCAVALLPVVGCRNQSKPSQSKPLESVESAKARQQNSGPVVSTVSTPEAQIYVDEALLKKPYAIIGGTVQNVAGERLENLSVQIELKGRSDGRTELRDVEVQPKDLAPGEQGRYSLKILSDEWSGSKILRLRSSSRQTDVAFKHLPGARRPPERVEPLTRVVQQQAPRKAQKSQQGEEFINTPDNPERIP